MQWLLVLPGSHTDTGGPGQQFLSSRLTRISPTSLFISWTNPGNERGEPQLHPSADPGCPNPAASSSLWVLLLPTALRGLQIPRASPTAVGIRFYIGLGPIGFPALFVALCRDTQLHCSSFPSPCTSVIWLKYCHSFWGRKDPLFTVRDQGKGNGFGANKLFLIVMQIQYGQQSSCCVGIAGCLQNGFGRQTAGRSFAGTNAAPGPTAKPRDVCPAQACARWFSLGPGGSGGQPCPSQYAFPTNRPPRSAARFNWKGRRDASQRRTCSVKLFLGVGRIAEAPSGFK